MREAQFSCLYIRISPNTATALFIPSLSLHIPGALLLQQRGPEGLRAPQKVMEKGRADSRRCQWELLVEPALSLLQR